MAASPEATPRARHGIGRLLRSAGLLLRPLWRIHPPVVIVVGANRPTALQTLTLAARPSTDRLHLRDLFAEGRRYYIKLDGAGFHMTSDTRLLFGSHRRRSGRSALIAATVDGDADSALTLIRLQARMFIWQAVRALLWPALFAIIILNVGWWDPALRIGLVLLLTALSWTAHRADAALQASEMMFFIQKALEDLPPAYMPTLESERPEIVSAPDAGAPDADFSAAWQRFYRQHQRDERAI
ncbi:MAG: hypothetical protein ACUVS2_10455 [Candidatus Flexifilum sp.]|jgi:hypothetical protein